MKKLLSLLIAITMVLSVSAVLAVCVSAQTEPWDGKDTSYDVNFAGTGTEEDPFLISTPEEMKGLQYNVNYLETNYSGQYLKLTDDINMGGHPFEAIGTNTAFEGIFDGNGKTVFNFTIEGKYGGLFGVIKNSAVVKNLKVDYANIATDTIRAGGISAYPQAESTVENCVVGKNVVVTNTETACDPILGGIVGQITNSTVKNCVSYASVVLNVPNEDAYAGGIAGAPGKSSVIENVISYANVLSEVANKTEGYYVRVGGIVGSAGSGNLDFTLTNAINYGSAKALGADGYAGGICGYANAVKNADICGTFKNVFNASTEILGNGGTGMFAGHFAKPVALVEGSTIKLMQTETMSSFAGIVADGLEVPGTGFTPASSALDFEIDEDVKAIHAAIDAALPEFAEVIDIDYDPSKDTTPETTTPVEPEDTGDEPVDTGDEPVDTGDKPVDTGDAPVDSGNDPEPTTPVTNPITPETDPETEKPAEGGCGSVVAGGLAILAVVTLAGVALKKKD